MRIRRILLVTALVTTVAAAGACGEDTVTSPTTTVAPVTLPDTTLPDTTLPDTTLPPDTTVPDTTLPDTTQPSDTTLPDTTLPDTTQPPDTTLPALVDVRVYFLRDERLVIEHADVAGPAVLRGALEALLAGPTDDALTSTIPAGTRLLGVNLVDGTATVDLSSEFGTGGGTLSMSARVGQVVFTATQFDNVDEVVFWLDGSPIEYLGGEGLVMTDPWTRADVDRDITGAVIVDLPRPGETVTSPFVVSGEADVYEGDFPIEIRRDGETLVVIAPVTGGAWGNWADFTTTVAIDAAPGPIDLVAYDEGGCGDAPECPPVIETVVPLILQ